MIAQVTRLGLHVGTGDAIGTARAAFERDSCVRLEHFLEPALVERFRSQLAAAPFRELVHVHVQPTPPVDLVLQSPSLDAQLHFLMNDPALFSTVERISGCDPIGCFIGRVYRMVPGQGHHDAWHTDMDDNRLVTISVNLGPGTYEGGVLQIRRRRDGRLIHEAANTRPGDAILFAISDDLEHRVTDVTGGAGKQALAGWFTRTPRYVDVLPRRPAHTDG